MRSLCDRSSTSIDVSSKISAGTLVRPRLSRFSIVSLSFTLSCTVGCCSLGDTDGVVGVLVLETQPLKSSEDNTRTGTIYGDFIGHFVR